MVERPTRRRAITIFASAAASLATVGASRAAEEWRGAALGAEVSIVFDEIDPASRRIAVDRIMAEIERQESIFSLQMATSELSRLNAEGRLARPSGDLLHVLDRARQIHAATSGKFDPTVQTLWRNYVAWYAADRGRQRPYPIAAGSALRTSGSPPSPAGSASAQCAQNRTRSSCLRASS